ncbi:hypothetical protein E2320_003367, partial [Naja naja]
QIDFLPKAKIFDSFSVFYFLSQAHFHWGTENSNGNSKNLNREFSLHSLWREAHVHHYFYYQGSLTFLPGAKSVIWFVCPVPLEISYPMHKLFTTSLFVTTTKEKRLMQNNFHPLQPLNGRSVYYSYYRTA